MCQKRLLSASLRGEITFPIIVVSDENTEVEPMSRIY